MPDDEIAAALAPTRKAHANGVRLEEAGNMNGALVSYSVAAAGIPRLLAALDEVLDLAGKARTSLSGAAPCIGSCEEGPCDCTGPRPLAWNLNPEAVRSAVLAALTNEDGHGSPGPSRLREA